MDADDPLQTYAGTGDDRAFEALARRYAGLVHASALSRTGSKDAAEEIVQNVFAKLSQWAARLSGKQSLSAWLYRVTRNESADYLRRESRCSRKMKDYQKHLEREIGAHEGEPISLSPLYDVLDALSETDRRLILLRFFEKQNYRDIAATIGKSEPACRKRAERALAKLGGLLRARGVKVSGAAPATLLTAQLSKAAPVNVISMASKAAITPVPLTLNSFLQFMDVSHSKGVLMSMAALALAIGGAGIWLGKTHRQMIERAEVISSQPEDIGIAGPLPDTPVESPVAFASEILERVRFLIRSPQTAHRLLEFELALVDLTLPQLKSIAAYTEGKLIYADEEDRAMASALLRKLVVLDPEAAFAFAEELGAWKNDVLPEVVTAWALADREAALEWIAKAEPRLRGRTFRAVLDAIGHTDRQAAIALFREGVADGLLPADSWDADEFFRGWIKEDPKVAIEEAFDLRTLANKNTAVMNAMTAWAKQDSQAAKGWLKEKEMDTALRNRLTIDYVDGLAEVDPKSAADFALEIDEKDTRTSAVSVVLQDWTAISFDDAATWVDEIKDTETRYRYQATLMDATRWRGDRDAAIAYGLEHYQENWRMYHELCMHAGSVVAEDPEGAIPWIRETFPERMHEELYQIVSHTTRRVNESQVHRYLDHISDPQERARHFESTGEHWASTDLEAAREWANALPESLDRDQALAGVARSWIQTDPEASANWMNALDPGHLRDELATRYVGEVSGRDPEAAVDMARGIQDERARACSMEHALREWQQQDPIAARAAIDANDRLSDSVRWRLLQGRSKNIRYPID